jgi:hypothetical protein
MLVPNPILEETENYGDITSNTHPKKLSRMAKKRKADASNLERGLLSLPVELATEILDYFPTIGPHTSVNSDNGYPVLHRIFHVRIDVLRALSQVCIHYRRVFLPLLWESLNICFSIRGPAARTFKYDKHLSETLVRKCDRLSANPKLASHIG